MKNADVRWVLAFDATCGRCREISDTVSQTCGEVLEVLPLSHPDVRGWLEATLGTAEPSAPALIRIDGTVTRAWTGPAMGLRLVRRLGVRSTVRLLTALGRWQREGSGESPVQAPRGVLGRAQFLRLGTGVVAAGLILSGRTPAYAARQSDEVQAWMEANKDQLPERYEELVTHPMAIRKAVYRGSEPAAKSRFWLDHLKSYKSAHPDLSAEQRAVLNDAVTLAAKRTTFPADGSTGVDVSLETLRISAVAAFGKDEARGLIARIGPADTHSNELAPMMQECDCNVESDWCISPCFTAFCYYSYKRCDCTSSGCGTFWAYACNGCCETCAWI